MSLARDSVAGAVVAFDLDGTLVDTAPDLIASLNAVLAERGLAPLPLSAARVMVGRGARAAREASRPASVAGASRVTSPSRKASGRCTSSRTGTPTRPFPKSAMSRPSVSKN